MRSGELFCSALLQPIYLHASVADFADLGWLIKSSSHANTTCVIQNKIVASSSSIIIHSSIHLFTYTFQKYEFRA